MFAFPAGLVAAAFAVATLVAPTLAAGETFLCVCPKEARPPDVVFRGVAVDATLLIADDGFSVRPRQATSFRVLRAEKGEAKTPMKVWHLTEPGRCGVSFGYGSTYVVKARLRNGEAETDACLMPELMKKPAGADIP